MNHEKSYFVVLTIFSKDGEEKRNILLSVLSKDETEARKKALDGARIYFLENRFGFDDKISVKVYPSFLENFIVDKSILIYK